MTCDLPEYEEELQWYVVDRIAFEHTSCYKGLLTLMFGFRVADVIVQAYQDYECEQIGIPLDPLRGAIRWDAERTGGQGDAI